MLSERLLLIHGSHQSGAYRCFHQSGARSDAVTDRCSRRRGARPHWPGSPRVHLAQIAASAAGSNRKRSRLASSEILWPGVIRYVVARRVCNTAPLTDIAEAEANRSSTRLGLGKGHHDVTLVRTTLYDRSTTPPDPTSPARETRLTRRRIPLKGTI